jgi:hypothetical protein
MHIAIQCRLIAFALLATFLEAAQLDLSAELGLSAQLQLSYPAAR